MECVSAVFGVIVVITKFLNLWMLQFQMKGKKIDWKLKVFMVCMDLEFSNNS